MYDSASKKIGIGEPLKTPVRYLKGVGPKKAEDLGRIGISTVEDLLYYLPARYEDRSTVAKIRDLAVGEAQLVRGEIVSASDKITRTGTRVFQMTVTDGSGFLPVVWFHQPYLKNTFRPGQKVALYGKVERYDRVQMIQPEYELVKPDEPDSPHMGRIVPVYPATADLSQKYLRGLMYAAVTKFARTAVERLPTYIIAREKLVDAKFAAWNIHFPATFEILEKAYGRIVFQEFLMLQLALAMRKKDLAEADAALVHRTDGWLLARFRERLRFELTAGQKKAIADIERDMASGKPMNRLVEGDVGSGKTIVAAHALALTVQNGYQGVIMAPTELLARQHFLTLGELFMPLGVTVGLIVGGMDDMARSAVYGGVKDGGISILVGTHAVIQEELAFHRLGLAVVDEQHKFGVEQRAILKQKAHSPHVMIMTATPIPRTLALTVYGDLDVSIIKELPKGRKPVATYVVSEDRRDRVYGFVREELAKGRQAYVVCPLIQTKGQEVLSEKSEVKDATAMYDRLHREVFPEATVGLIHGRMEVKEKEKVMKDFKKGAIQVLVSTVVIEVGIDVPNATIMIVENAERFGLSQLHQLRGRIGRGQHESFCVLLADPQTDDAAERLKAIEATTDGFQIAEADLSIRGPGQFFGTRQHGLPEIRVGNIVKDIGIMERARRIAFEIVAQDPALAHEHHRLLKAALKERFRDKVSLGSVG